MSARVLQQLLVCAPTYPRPRPYYFNAPWTLTSAQVCRVTTGI